MRSDALPSSNFEVLFLKQRIQELETQINHIKSVTINTMIEIGIAAEEEDYDEIKAICDAWGNVPEEEHSAKVARGEA